MTRVTQIIDCLMTRVTQMTDEGNSPFLNSDEGNSPQLLILFMYSVTAFPGSTMHYYTVLDIKKINKSLLSSTNKLYSFTRSFACLKVCIIRCLLVDENRDLFIYLINYIHDDHIQRN